MRRVFDEALKRPDAVQTVQYYWLANKQVSESYKMSCDSCWNIMCVPADRPWSVGDRTNPVYSRRIRWILFAVLLESIDRIEETRTIWRRLLLLKKKKYILDPYQYVPIGLCKMMMTEY